MTTTLRRLVNPNPKARAVLSLSSLLRYNELNCCRAAAVAIEVLLGPARFADRSKLSSRYHSQPACAYIAAPKCLSGAVQALSTPPQMPLRNTPHFAVLQTYRCCSARDVCKCSDLSDTGQAVLKGSRPCQNATPHPHNAARPEKDIPSIKVGGGSPLLRAISMPRKLWLPTTGITETHGIHVASGFYRASKKTVVPKFWKLLVIPTGFEPVAYRLGICRSILLSYGTIQADRE